MEALEINPVVRVMESYLSCPQCQRNFLCGESFQEHMSSCQIESSFPLISDKIRAKESGLYTENDHNQFQDDHDSIQNLHSTYEKGEYFCTHCPPAITNTNASYGLRECDERSDAFCHICGEVFDQGVGLILHARSHQSCTSNLPESSNAKTEPKSPVTLYPIVEFRDQQYFCCGFPGCEKTFSNRRMRLMHHKKYHDDAPWSMYTYLTGRYSEEEANKTSCVQFNENSGKKMNATFSKRKAHHLLDYPIVQVQRKQDFVIPDCQHANCNLEAMILQQQRSEKSSEETRFTTVENSMGTNSMKIDVKQKSPKHLQIERPAIVHTNGDDMLGETVLPNSAKISDISIQNNDDISAQSPVQFLVVVLDEDYVVNEQEMADLQNKSIDTSLIEHTDADARMERIPLLNPDFNAQDIFLSHGELICELSNETSASDFNPVQSNISNPALTEENDAAHQSPIQHVKNPWVAWQSNYPTIQVGSEKLFCCDFPGCAAVFNSRRARYTHHSKHRKGHQHVKSRLRLYKDMVWDSAERCYIIE